MGHSLVSTESWTRSDSRVEDSEIPLTYLSIGIWNKRRRGPTSISVLLLHSSQRFVVLLDQTAASQVTRQGITRVIQRLTASSPFKCKQAGNGSVLAFEVEWKHIVGIDYSNPLCLPGRLVLEVRQMVKREFSCMKDVYRRYAPHLSAFHRQASAPNIDSLSNTQSSGVLLYPRPLSADAQATGGLGFTGNWQPSSSLELRGGGSELRRRGSRKPNSNPGFDVEDLCNTSSSPGESKAVGDAPPVSEGCENPGPRQSPFAVSANRSAVEAPGNDAQIQCYEEAASEEPFAPLPANPVAALFNYRSVTVNFQDPGVPQALRPAIEGDERLLKLYESGLPAWAIYAPQYGVWYRPWMRRVTYMLFILVSTFSLVMGFYDLYKNVPYLDQFLRQVVSAVLPSTAILQWLDEHVSFRLSILFAYLFGKSEVAVQILRWLGTLGAFFKNALQPVSAVVGPPLAAFGGILHQSWQHVASVVKLLWELGSLTAAAVFGPPFAAFLGALSFVHQLLKPVVQVVSSISSSIIFGPWIALKLFVGSLAASGAAAAQTLRILAQASVAAWQAVKTGTRITPAVTSNAVEFGSQVKTWYVVFPLEALEVVKNSTVKVVRALQTLLRLCSQVASDIARHRLTLKLRMHRTWVRVKARLSQLVPPKLQAFWLRVTEEMDLAEGIDMQQSEPGSDPGATSSGSSAAKAKEFPSKQVEGADLEQNEMEAAVLQRNESSMPVRANETACRRQNSRTGFRKTL